MIQHVHTREPRAPQKLHRKMEFVHLTFMHIRWRSTWRIHVKNSSIFFCTRINNFWFRFSHNSCGTLMHITHTYTNTKYTHSSHVSLSLSSCYPKKVVRGCHKCWFNDIQLDSQGSSLTFTAWPCLFFFFFFSLSVSSKWAGGKQIGCHPEDCVGSEFTKLSPFHSHPWVFGVQCCVELHRQAATTVEVTHPAVCSRCLLSHVWVWWMF